MNQPEVAVLGRELRSAATQVLRQNDTGRYTLPSRSTYPHQWNWDSALIALGWAEIDPARAWTELETLAAARDEQGMIPHIAFHRTVLPRLTSRYLPGPRWWGRRVSADGRRISGITQPPLAASCMRLVFERHPDERRARALLAPFHDWHRFLLDVRDPEGRGEPVLIHPWESGRDNAVEWDGPLWRVIPEVVVVRRRDTDSVDAAERPSLEHYRRFLTLVRRGTAARWNQRELAMHGTFRVLDAGFSGILARAVAMCLSPRPGLSRASAEPALVTFRGESSTASTARIRPSEPARARSAAATRSPAARLSSAMRASPSCPASSARSAHARARIPEKPASSTRKVPCMASSRWFQRAAVPLRTSVRKRR